MIRRKPQFLLSLRKLTKYLLSYAILQHTGAKENTEIDTYIHNAHMV